MAVDLRAGSAPGRFDFPIPSCSRRDPLPSGLIASRSRRVARPAAQRLRPTALHRRRRVFLALVLLNVVELAGVVLVGPGFWIGFAVSFTVLLADLLYLRRRAVAAARVRRAELRRARWVAAQQRPSAGNTTVERRRRSPSCARPRPSARRYAGGPRPSTSSGTCPGPRRGVSSALRHRSCLGRRRAPLLCGAPFKIAVSAARNFDAVPRALTANFARRMSGFVRRRAGIWFARATWAAC